MNFVLGVLAGVRTMFKIDGIYRGRSVAVTWDAGRLISDDDSFVRDAEQKNRMTDRGGPPPGPHTRGYGNHLTNGLSALILLLDMFDGDPAVTGNVPHIPLRSDAIH